MASFHARNGAGELLARYSFVEPLLAGKRVLELGAARATAGASGLLLAERGAAAVLSLEPEEADLDEARAAGHHPFVQYRAGDPAALRPGTFDLVLVADGAELAREPDRVARLRRLLAPGGRLVTAVAAGGAGLADLAGEPPAAALPAYEAFVNALSDQFPLVEVAAASATVGWIFGIGAAEDPDIAMDGTLAGTPETAAYVAICGDEPSGLEGFTVVALPVHPLVEEVTARLGDGGPAAAGALAAARDRAEAAAIEARRERDGAVAGAAEAREATAQLEAAVEKLRGERDAAR
ncbi:class I SAM-dependent methyltransferase, partial [Anaeromyxobacter oryzisoli]|uniref:class I SAM-dependent methyltransferase n=1 Tax=Anaeromyxobacter oryzisoli TaxID=2925408 RepID=UPI001F561A56